jgi:SNF2 family DNA or RNA helicase
MAFTPAANAQAADRCHRLGQKNSVLVLTLKVKDSVEDRIIEICMNKQNIVDEMIGDEATVMNRLTQEELETLI